MKPVETRVMCGDCNAILEVRALPDASGANVVERGKISTLERELAQAKADLERENALRGGWLETIDRLTRELEEALAAVKCEDCKEYREVVRRDALAQRCSICGRLVEHADWCNRPTHVGNEGYAAVPIVPGLLHDPHCCASRGCHKVCSHLCGTDLATHGCCEQTLDQQRIAHAMADQSAEQRARAEVAEQRIAELEGRLALVAQQRDDAEKLSADFIAAHGNHKCEQWEAALRGLLRQVLDWPLPLADAIDLKARIEAALAPSEDGREEKPCRQCGRPTYRHDGGICDSCWTANGNHERAPSGDSGQQAQDGKCKHARFYLRTCMDCGAREDEIGEFDAPPSASAAQDAAPEKEPRCHCGVHPPLCSCVCSDCVRYKAAWPAAPEPAPERIVGLDAPQLPDVICQTCAHGISSHWDVEDACMKGRCPCRRFVRAAHGAAPVPSRKGGE